MQTTVLEFLEAEYDDATERLEEFATDWMAEGNDLSALIVAMSQFVNEVAAAAGHTKH